MDLQLVSAIALKVGVTVRFFTGFTFIAKSDIEPKFSSSPFTDIACLCVLLPSTLDLAGSQKLGFALRGGESKSFAADLCFISSDRERDVVSMF